PFCLFACSNEPHSPWNKGDAGQYPPSQVKLPPYLPDTPQMREGFSRYLAEITYFDSQVGQLLELLDEYELASNTVVIVLSEQGNSMPFAKWTCYDSGLQSAMLVRWPGQVEPGVTTDAMVEYVDVLPTMMEIAGIDDRQSVLDGRSFLPVLRGESNEHKSYVYGAMTTRGIINGNDCYPIRSVRSGTHKLIWNLQHDQPFTNACVKSPEFVSLIKAADAGNQLAAMAVDRYQNRPEFEFYDLIADPLEMHDLSSEPDSKKIMADLRSQLSQWMAAQGDLGVETEMKSNDHKKKSSRLGGKKKVK
ncbi:MAG: sulfatase/phosphatase domain-containing protein, partial [Rubripirellula sp.]